MKAALNLNMTSTPAMASLSESDLLTRIGTVIVAAYGAILGTYTFFLQQRDKKPRLRVTVGTSAIGSALGVSSPLTRLTVANIGQRNVILTSKKLQLPDGKFAHLLEGWGRDREYPVTLTPGDGTSIWREGKAVALEMKKNGYSGIINGRLSFGMLPTESTGVSHSHSISTCGLERVKCQLSNYPGFDAAGSCLALKSVVHHSVRADWKY